MDVRAEPPLTCTDNESIQEIDGRDGGQFLSSLEMGVGDNNNASDIINDTLHSDKSRSRRLHEDIRIRYLQARMIVASAFKPIGLDIHTFLVGWYNEKVDARFQLKYPEDTVAFVVINGPHMFEKCIIPYAKERIRECSDFQSNKLMDDSVKHAFAIVQSDLQDEGFETEAFFDFDLYPSRRPKVLVQTAAHVAGAVQYLHKRYLPLNIQQDRFGKKSSLNGVAIHPDYGGWFAIRGVMIFSNLRLSEDAKCIRRPDPVEIFTDPAQISKVIELFAYNWQTNEWRNVHKGLGLKYSDDFMQYLSMDTAKRWEFVKSRCSSVEDDFSDSLVSEKEVPEYSGQDGMSEEERTSLIPSVSGRTRM